MPASVADTPRQPTSVSATKASTPKNMQVRIPRRRTAAGRTGRATRVPGGVSFRSAKRPIRMPATLSTTVGMGSPLVSPTVSRPAPRATVMASGRRPRRARAVSSATGGASATFRSAPSVSAAASAMSGSRPEEHVPPAGHLADRAGDRRPDHAGQDPGRREHREHARPQVLGESPADGDVRDRLDRAGAEALDEAGGHQEGHGRCEAARQEADGEQPETGGERDRQAAPVDRAADHHDPDERAEEERREDPAVELEPAQLLRDDRHDRRDRQGLEADQGDGQDEAEGQGATIGAPEAVLRVAGRAVHAQRMAGIAEARHGRSSRVFGGRSAALVAAAFDHRPARRSTIGASSSTSPSMTELIPSRSRSPTSFSTRPSIEPMNRCGDSRTSSEVSSTPVRPRR